MTLFAGLNRINELTPNMQLAFDSFYQGEIKQKVLPIVTDFTLAIILFGSMFNILTQLTVFHKTPAEIPGAIYLYTLSVAVLLLLHRFTPLRRYSLQCVYAVYASLMTVSYLGYYHLGGGIDPVFGLFFTMAFLGMTTSSVKHTLIIVSVNIAIILFLSVLMFGINEGGSKALSLLTNWFIFMCMVMAITTATFSFYAHKNQFAMQFLLQEKNDTLKQTFRTLEATEKQLVQQQKYQALNHMAKGLLHEIINPVNSASQALAFAQSVNTDEDVNEALAEALLQQQRISSIVTDLRSFSQPETDTSERQDVSVLSLLTQAIKFCQQEIDKTACLVKLSVPESHRISVHPSALTQVFVNVLLNACDALKAKPQNLARSIAITTTLHKDSLGIKIKDNGMGITPEVLKRITEPFFSQQESPEKMGLGLSICQTIMRHHGGTLEIDSQEGAWTEVSLTLPVTEQVTDEKTLAKHRVSGDDAKPVSGPVSGKGLTDQP